MSDFRQGIPAPKVQDWHRRPPRNDIDVYCNDVGVVPIVDQNGTSSYNIHVGGSMGMSHGKEATFPALAMPLCFISRNT